LRVLRRAKETLLDIYLGGHRRAGGEQEDAR
jgi:hypothetical protein